MRKHTKHKKSYSAVVSSSVPIPPLSQVSVTLADNSTQTAVKDSVMGKMTLRQLDSNCNDHSAEHCYKDQGDAQSVHAIEGKWLFTHDVDNFVFHMHGVHTQKPMLVMEHEHCTANVDGVMDRTMPLMIKEDPN